jgi:hypothetical protein
MDDGCVCDISCVVVVRDDMYVIISLSCWKEKNKKNSQLCQVWHSTKRPLPSAMTSLSSATTMALGKARSKEPSSQLCKTLALGIEFFVKNVLRRVQNPGTQQRIFLKKYKIFVECHISGTQQRLAADFFCRVLTWHLAKALSSVRYVALGKETFVYMFFAECSLPSALSTRQSSRIQ